MADTEGGDGTLPFDDPEAGTDWIGDANRRFVNRARVDAIRKRLEQPHTAREPCPRCDTTDAYIERVGNQDVVRCGLCGRALYNAPKTETGRAPRTVSNLRPGIKASRRARILDRDLGRCVLCGATERLNVGHMLSVEDGYALGVGNDVLFSDENLAALCETCNLGFGNQSVNARTYLRVMGHLILAEQKRATSDTVPG